MFIAYTKNNERFVENKIYNGKPLTWNDIPTDVSITALTLTHPTLTTSNDSKISPKVSIKKYHYYYFFNEATMSVTQSSEGGPKKTNASLVAKIMAGVDIEKRYVLEIRLDKFGNTSISSYPLEALLRKFNIGTMKRSCLRTGIDCTKDKKLL